MTTPAVNIDATEIQSCNWLKQYCGATDFTVYDTSTARIRRLIDHRPASTNNPRVSGWRQPAGYFRNGAHMTVQPQGHYSILYSEPWCPSGQGAEDRWDNGYGWDLVISDVPGIPSWMSDSAASKALLKLQAEKVNLSTNFAERKQMEHLFIDTLSDIADTVRNFRKKASKKIWEAVKREGTRDRRGKLVKVPQKWLELQYGWNPLLDDLKNTGNLLAEHDKKNKYRILVHSNVKQSYKKHWIKGSHIASHIWQDVTDEVTQNVKMMLCYQLNNPLTRSLSELGITNPADLIWEEIPYSFVVDWVLPIGNWLQTFDADFGLSFQGGSVTEFTKVKSRSQLGESQSGLPPGMLARNNSVPYKYDGFVFNRGALLEPPGVGFPHFKNPFSALHVSEALSLLATAFR